jgi:4-amino-4-deoxychorismate lyase
VEGPICPADTQLIETFAWLGDRFRRLDFHLARLYRSADALGFALDHGAIADALDQINGPKPLRIRLTLGLDGAVGLTSASLAPNPAEWRISVAPDRLDSADPFLQHKTTQRRLYDQTRAALPAGVDEVIFLNERDEVCEGTISNLFFDLGRGLMTPPLTSGCLPGVLRAERLASGTCAEALLMARDLPRAKLWMGNSLRGLIPARLVERVSRLT